MLRVSFYICNMMYYTLNVVFQSVFPGLLGQWKLFAHISCWPVLSRNNISRFAQWTGQYVGNEIVLHLRRKQLKMQAISTRTLLNLQSQKASSSSKLLHSSRSETMVGEGTQRSIVYPLCQSIVNCFSGCFVAPVVDAESLQDMQEFLKTRWLYSICYCTLSNLRFLGGVNADHD